MSTPYVIASIVALILFIWCTYEMWKAEPEDRSIYDADDEYECQHPSNHIRYSHWDDV